MIDTCLQDSSTFASTTPGGQAEEKCKEMDANSSPLIADLDDDALTQQNEILPKRRSSLARTTSASSRDIFKKAIMNPLKFAKSQLGTSTKSQFSALHSGPATPAMSRSSGSADMSLSAGGRRSRLDSDEEPSPIGIKSTGARCSPEGGLLTALVRKEQANYESAMQACSARSMPAPYRKKESRERRMVDGSSKGKSKVRSSSSMDRSSGEGRNKTRSSSTSMDRSCDGRNKARSSSSRNIKKSDKKDEESGELGSSSRRARRSKRKDGGGGGGEGGRSRSQSRSRASAAQRSRSSSARAEQRRRTRSSSRARGSIARQHSTQQVLQQVVGAADSNKRTNSTAANEEDENNNVSRIEPSGCTSALPTLVPCLTPCDRDKPTRSASGQSLSPESSVGRDDSVRSMSRREFMERAALRRSSIKKVAEPAALDTDQKSYLDISTIQGDTTKVKDNEGENTTAIPLSMEQTPRCDNRTSVSPDLFKRASSKSLLSDLSPVKESAVTKNSEELRQRALQRGTSVKNIRVILDTDQKTHLTGTIQGDAKVKENKGNGATAVQQMEEQPRCPSRQILPRELCRQASLLHQARSRRDLMEGVKSRRSLMEGAAHLHSSANNISNHKSDPERTIQSETQVKENKEDSTAAVERTEEQIQSDLPLLVTFPAIAVSTDSRKKNSHEDDTHTAPTCGHVSDSWSEHLSFMGDEGVVEEADDIHSEHCEERNTWLAPRDADALAHARSMDLLLDTSGKSKVESSRSFSSARSSRSSRSSRQTKQDQIPALPLRKATNSQRSLSHRDMWNSNESLGIESLSFFGTAGAEKEEEAVPGWSCSCGEHNKDNFNFCPICGTCKPPPKKVFWDCEGCGRTDNESRFNFCVGCGTRQPTNA